MIEAVNAVLAAGAVLVLGLAHLEVRRAQKYRALARQMAADALESEAAASRKLREARAAFQAVDRSRALQVLQLEADFNREWQRWKGGKA